MPYLSRNRIENIAGRAVNAYKKLPALKNQENKQVDPELFARDLLGLSVEYHVLSPDGSILGATSCGPVGIPIYDTPASPDYCFMDGKTVLIERGLVSEGANRGRYHFTLMHEACHQILGMLFPADIGRNAPQCRIHYCMEENTPGEDYWDEWRANALAAAILMPVDMIQDNLKRFELGEKIHRLNKVFSPKEYKRFCEMAEYMGVSKQALSIRLSHLGLLKRNNLEDPFRLVNIFPGDEWVQMERDMDEEERMMTSGKI